LLPKNSLSSVSILSSSSTISILPLSMFAAPVHCDAHVIEDVQAFRLSYFTLPDHYTVGWLFCNRYFGLL
jgi:hypothetical protein